MTNDNNQQDKKTDDGIDRRGFLKCMAWVGTGLVWTFNGGIPTSRVFGADSSTAAPVAGDFSFVQISDSHIGFAKDPNKDVVGTLRETIARINGLPTRPEFLLHTGDLTHLSKPDEFDTVAQVIKETKTGQAFYVPGEHDFFTDDGKQYLDRYGKGTLGTGWQSFDYKGVHFVGLVNVANLKPGGLGSLGDEQIAWLEKDLVGKGDSTPVV
ncbi:MAG TPA: metallophosphoesterase, partial [Tepidisphaeraceae bacterium]|nr:metallophosphoesterase [Tepidisphaeraceae bacterium]